VCIRRLRLAMPCRGWRLSWREAMPMALRLPIALC
jgi:hypothetical protein